MYMHFLSIILLANLINVCAISYKILCTPVIGCLPFLRLHHIVVLSNNEKSIYTIDFTPDNQSQLITQLKMVLAFNVPAEIRIRNIKNVNFNDEKSIIENWKLSTQTDNIESKIINTKTYNSIMDKKIKQLMNQIFQYQKKDMNMYINNCQHFSYFVVNDILDKNTNLLTNK